MNKIDFNTIKDTILDKNIEAIAEVVNKDRGYYTKIHTILDSDGQLRFSILDWSGAEAYLDDNEILISISYPMNYIGDNIDDFMYEEDEDGVTRADDGYTTLDILTGFEFTTDCFWTYYIDDTTLATFLDGAYINF